MAPDYTDLYSERQTALGLTVCLVAVVVVHRGGGRRGTTLTAARAEPEKNRWTRSPGPA
ncbi:hypothetical protein [Streptomyces sp. D2-8]|uniref:hypothetical protein n=1 Tax=Streptomyces sp. D2-8 TaxID=2707767 RepID=UPI0020BEB864|nr:hypothetical protein [Streptomyces sp. D2-8]